MKLDEFALDEYQKLANRTRSDRGDQNLTYAGMAIAGEAGEILDIIKKVQFHGHELSHEVQVKLALEAGDVMWGVAELATVLGLRLSDIAKMNLEKLQRRYPDGFHPERSKNRKP